MSWLYFFQDGNLYLTKWVVLIPIVLIVFVLSRVAARMGRDAGKCLAMQKQIKDAEIRELRREIEELKSRR